MLPSGSKCTVQPTFGVIKKEKSPQLGYSFVYTINFSTKKKQNARVYFIDERRRLERHFS